MPFEVKWTQEAHTDLSALFDYVGEQSSLWDADRLYERLLASTKHLSEFPRLYEAAPQYGEGVRRIGSVSV